MNYNAKTLHLFSISILVFDNHWEKYHITCYHLICQQHSSCAVLIKTICKLLINIHHSYMDNTYNRHQHDTSDSNMYKAILEFFEAQCLILQYVQGQFLKYYYFKTQNVYG